MTASFSEVRAALAAQVADVSGLLAVHERVPDSFSGPCAVVQPANGDFLLNPIIGENGCDYLFLVTLYVPGADADAGQILMDGFLAPTGASSVMAAINADGSLGGVVSSAKCNRARNYRAETIDEQRNIAVDFQVEVMT